MNDNCIICLHNIKHKSYFQICLHKMNESCKCNYKIHNLCLFELLKNDIRKKQNTCCLLCKEEFINYNESLKNSNILLKRYKYFQKIISFIFQSLMIISLINSFHNLIQDIYYNYKFHFS
ncbi:hypothetical protein CL656_05610 [bacterium]|nr:hypothetical protein [bacterium]